MQPQISRLEFPINSGAHTVFPLFDMEIADFKKSKDSKRDFIFVVNESINDECREARQMVWIVDVTQETKPFGVANWTVPEASGNFCDRGARFGAHASNENMTPILLQAADVRDVVQRRRAHARYPQSVSAARKSPITFRRSPRETKPDPTCVKRRGADARAKIAIQTNNVEVDDRGYIYITDRADTGLHILELTGEARKLANFK